MVTQTKPSITTLEHAGSGVFISASAISGGAVATLYITDPVEAVIAAILAFVFAIFALAPFVKVSNLPKQDQAIVTDMQKVDVEAGKMSPMLTPILDTISKLAESNYATQDYIRTFLTSVGGALSSPSLVQALNDLNTKANQELLAKMEKDIEAMIQKYYGQSTSKTPTTP